MRAVVISVVAVLVVALAACGGDEEGPEPPDEPSAGATRLEVKVWPEGRPGEDRSATVVCDDPRAGGEDCAAAEQVDPDALAPTPPDVACTQIFGGPQEATIEGTLRGEELDVELSRRNGCEISRWEAAEALLELVRNGTPSA